MTLHALAARLRLFREENVLDFDKSTSDFWATADQLVAWSEIEIDRPMNTRHPLRHEVVYPLDYGSLTDTRAGDGQWVDVWRGSQDSSQTVACVAMVDPIRRDAELKLLLGCTSEEIDTVEDFYQRHGLAVVMVRRGDTATDAPPSIVAGTT